MAENGKDITERLLGFAGAWTGPQRADEIYEITSHIHGTHCLRKSDLEEAAAEIVALRARVEWQPIETAPHARHVLAARFMDDSGDWMMAVVASPPSKPFTHWMPLPPPPGPETE